MKYSGNILTQKPSGRSALSTTARENDCAIYSFDSVDQILTNSIQNLSGPQLEYIKALIRNGIHHYIENIPPDVDYALIENNGCALPFSVSDREASAFPISPKTCYFSYPLLIESKDYGRLNAPIARSVLGFLQRCVRFDKLVVLNNWFITNNPSPAFSAEDLQKFVKTLRIRFPKHMILMKSVPEIDPTKIIGSLQKCGFNLINWRLCYYWRPSGPRQSKRTKQFRVDRRLLDKTHLNKFYTNKMTDVQSEACETLYQSLYIGKHTPMNVKLNRRWFSLVCNSGFVDFFMLADNATLKAFAISYKDPIGINTGFLGYDLKDGRELGLYRMVVVSTLLRGIDEDRTVNLSTGVSRFKELRGAAPQIEYEGVYTKHLSLSTRILMGIFIWAYNRFGDGIRSR